MKAPKLLIPKVCHMGDGVTSDEVEADDESKIIRAFKAGSME